MKFNVIKKATYTLDEMSITKFKTKMLECCENEMREDGTLSENEEFPYTINDISDEIVRNALADTIQNVFEENEDYTGITFDFDQIYLDFTEEDVRDCVYEAVANWMDALSI